MLPKMNMDDLVVAIRSIYGGQEPSMSIEPCRPGVKDGCMKVLYNGRFQDPDHPERGWLRYDESGHLIQADPPATWNTHFGHVLFESDRYLKTSTLGRNNLNPDELFQSGVPGFVSELDRMAGRAAAHPSYALSTDDGCLIQSEADRQRSSSCHRIWFVPSELTVKTAADGHTMEFEPVTIRTEARIVRFDASGQMVDVPGNDSAIADFVTHFNQHYLDFAREKPELAELIQLAKIVGLVRWMYDNNVPLDLAWIDRYQVSAGETPQTTTGVEIQSGGVRLYGGVEFPKQNTYSSGDHAPNGLSKTVLTARPSATDLSWELQQNGERLTAVALNVAPARIVGGYSTARIDAFVPIASGLAASFTRQYSSLDPSPGPLGRGWSLAMPSLTFRRAAVPQDPQRYYSQFELASRTQRTTFSLKTDGSFSPEDLASPYKTLGLTFDGSFESHSLRDLLLSPALGDQPIAVRDLGGKSLEYTGFVVLRKDGYTLAFDPIGHLTGVRDPAGNQVNYIYEKKQLMSIADASGRGIQFTYNAADQLAGLKTSDGYARQYGYDASGNLIAVSDETGTKIEAYAYDADGRLTRAQDGAGRVVLENLYDSLGRVTSFGAGQEYTSTVEYDHQANSVTYTAPGGNRFSQRYDEQNRLVEEADPLGKTIVFQYDQHDHLTDIRDRNGNTTKFTYDENGFLVEAIAPTGDRTRMLNYNTNGLPEFLIDPADRMAIFEYDSYGRIASVKRGLQLKNISPGGQINYFEANSLTEAYEYDPVGNISAIRASDGSMTRFTYDQLGNLVRVGLPGGEEIEQAFDEHSQLIAVTDPSGYKVRFGYDQHGQLATVTTPAGTSGYQYTNGYLTSATNPLSHTIRYGYNPAGILESVTEPGGAITHYKYITSGNLASIQDALGRHIAYEYDVLGRLVAETRAQPPDEPEPPLLLPPVSFPGWMWWAVSMGLLFLGISATTLLVWGRRRRIRFEDNLMNTSSIQPIWYQAKNKERHLRQVVVTLPPQTPILPPARLLSATAAFAHAHWAVSTALVSDGTPSEQKAVVFVKATDVIAALRGHSVTVAFAFFYLRTGGVVQLLVQVNSSEVTPKADKQFLGEYMCWLENDADRPLVATLINQKQLELCFVASGAQGPCTPYFGVVVDLPSACREALKSEWSKLISFHSKLSPLSVTGHESAEPATQRRKAARWWKLAGIVGASALLLATVIGTWIVVVGAGNGEPDVLSPTPTYVATTPSEALPTQIPSTPTLQPQPTSVAVSELAKAAVAQAVKGGKPSPTPEPTPAPAQASTPLTTGGRVIGTIQDGANISVALIPQESDGRFTIELRDGVPQAQTDGTGHFEFVDVPSGAYIIVSPVGDGGFRIYAPPTDSSLIVGYAGPIWMFQVNAEQTIDFGVLPSQNTVRPFDPSFPVVVSPSGA
jgi:YD repeat-containing protein